MNSDNSLEPSTTDKPIMARGPADHPQLAQLPEWPTRTIAVLSTSDGGPHAIPVAAPGPSGRPAHPRFGWNAPGVRWLACVRTHTWRWQSSPPAIALSQH